MDELFNNTVLTLIQVVEAVGIAVMLGGFIVATVVYVSGFRKRTSHQAYVDYRRRSVRGLILGLEFLVAADIIRTVTVDYSVASVAVLGMVVLIRSFLVFALHLEVEGRLPWEKEEDPSEA
jgi:uncharacterized membrane protein